ncbi:hypothetical protein [[Pseudomonas] boreopolis]|uniref:hypothetical protein n=2 Tax=Gammaproteobacteria TaxID=1236 RepID=UPI0011283AE6
MSLLILQGPGIPPEGLPPVLPSRCAGHGIGRVSCEDVEAMAAALRAVPASDAALVLIEPGELQVPRSAIPSLRRTFDALPVPYIELHADGGAELEAWLHPQHGPMAVVVTPHDRARGYAMSLGIAARRLASIEDAEGADRSCPS